MIFTFLVEHSCSTKPGNLPELVACTFRYLQAQTDVPVVILNFPGNCDREPRFLMASDPLLTVQTPVRRDGPV